jgi:hypothetical protein
LFLSEFSLMSPKNAWHSSPFKRALLNTHQCTLHTVSVLFSEKLCHLPENIKLTSPKAPADPESNTVLLVDLVAKEIFKSKLARWFPDTDN